MENCMPLRSLAVILMVLPLSSFSLDLYEFPIRNLVCGHTDCAYGLFILSGRVVLGLGLGLGLELVRCVFDGLIFVQEGRTFLHFLHISMH